MTSNTPTVFLGDFIYRLVTAPARGAYFFRHFGWADLLASVPVPEFKVLRIFRLLRVYRLLATLGVRPVLRTRSALLTLLLAGILILEFGSLRILYSMRTHRTPTSRPPPTPCGTRS